MKLNDVTEYIWKNAIRLEFGNEESWNTETFQREWYKNKPQEGYDKWEKGGASGVYWFLVKDQSLESFINIPEPIDLPKKAINVNKTVTSNLNIFKEENISRFVEDKYLVFYNGHDNNIFGRIRTHFALNNDHTSAIALSKYNLSKCDFQVRLFHSKLSMGNLEPEKKEFIKNLLNDKVGREALESYWRANYGWPILCNR